MDYKVKLAAYEDMERCVAVEEETMPSGTYLRDAWHYFNSLKGGMVCVYSGEKMIGIGRFSVLFDGTGWLETLRVIPPFQNQGAGKAIYRKWLELAEELKCPSMAMFTGPTNVRSAGLADRFGLRDTYVHHVYALKELGEGDPHGFRHIAWHRAVELILPKKEEYHNYICFNRTFYRINEANAKGFSIEGKTFEDPESGSFIVIGARFQHQRTMHIGMMGGDLDRCLDFAVSYAKANGNKSLTCTFCAENEELQAALEKRGFTYSNDLITKERKFDWSEPSV